MFYFEMKLKSSSSNSKMLKRLEREMKDADREVVKLQKVIMSNYVSLNSDIVAGERGTRGREIVGEGGERKCSSG